MKFQICLALFVITASAQTPSDDPLNDWKKWSEDCEAETGASREAIIKLLNNELDEVDDKISAHVLCFSKKAGLADDNGNIMMDQLKIKLRKAVDNEEMVEKIINKCVVKKDTPEKTAIGIFQCIRENKPEFSPV